MTKTTYNRSSEPIAITAMALRFPGCSIPDHFWEQLLRQPASPQPLDWSRWLEVCPESNGKDIHAFQISDVAHFCHEQFGLDFDSAAKFGYEQRHILELAKICMEAGNSKTKQTGDRIAVFIGTSGSSIGPDGLLFPSDLSDGTSGARAMIANRTSQLLNLRGPSFTVDTMCSSTFAAIALAYDSIVNRRATAALAGGIRLFDNPSHFTILRNMNLLSPTGKCIPFGETSDGFVLGEGAACFLLKSLETALSEGDPVLAIIRSVESNHCGTTFDPKLPDAASIERILLDAWENSGIDPSTISHIETQASGIPLADAIEVQGMTSAFKNHFSGKKICTIGSVKSHVGNCEASSGAAALIKAISIMKNKCVPPQHFGTKLNPLLFIDQSPFTIPSVMQHLSQKESPARIGINNFGIGGANFHIIIEEFSPEQRTTFHQQKNNPNAGNESEKGSLLLISAYSRTHLERKLKTYLDLIASVDENEINRTCNSISSTAEMLRCRIAFVFNNRNDLIEAINSFLTTGAFPSHFLTAQYKEIPIYQDNPARRNDGFFRKRFQTKTSLSSNTLRVENIPIVVVSQHGQADVRLTRLLNKLGFCKIEFVSDQVESSIFNYKKEQFDRRVFLIFDTEINCSSASEQHRHWVIDMSRYQAEYHYSISLISALFFVNDIPFSREYITDFLIKEGRIVIPLVEPERTKNSITPLRLKKVEEEAIPIVHNLSTASKEQTRSLFLPSSLSDDRLIKTLADIIIETIHELYPIVKTPLDLHSNYANLGLDSVFAPRLALKLSKALGVNVPPVFFYIHQTITETSVALQKIIKKNQNIPLIQRDLPICLVPACKDHFSIISSWLSDPATSDWLDSFFSDGFTIREYGFFIRKHDTRLFIIEDKDGPMGLCGLAGIDEKNRSAESWIAIGKNSKRSSGAAFLAGIELCNKAFYEMNLLSLICKIADNNILSLALIESGGWQHVGRLIDWIPFRSGLVPCRLYQLHRDNFRSLVHSTSAGIF